MAKQQSVELKITVVALVAGTVIIILWLANLLILGGWSEEDRGTFGDMFGGLNALFSGLAFVGLIYAILLQKVEIGLQKDELEQTREEIKGQREALEDQKGEFEKQNEALKLQIFEGTLFQLISTFTEIASNIDIAAGNEIHTGKDGIKILYHRFRDTSEGRDRDLGWERKYEIFYRANSHEVAHYFRILYRIFRYIEESAPKERMDFYVKIIRAQMSRYENAFLFYNSLSPQGQKFKRLVNDFALLKFLDPEDLVSPTDILEHDPEAFGDKIAREFYNQQLEKA